MRVFRLSLTLVVLVSLSGCEEPASSSSAPPSSAPRSAPSPSRAPSPTDDSSETDADAATAAGDFSGADDVERQVAEVGVGKKGRNYGGGVVSEPIRAMFRTEQRMQLLQVNQAMQLYKASNGYHPKSHDIFWKEIIEANSIQLPELPEGERYVYDPELEELMVERPK